MLKEELLELVRKAEEAKNAGEDELKSKISEFLTSECKKAATVGRYFTRIGLYPIVSEYRISYAKAEEIVVHFAALNDLGVEITENRIAIISWGN